MDGVEKKIVDEIQGVAQIIKQKGIELSRTNAP
jgi:hypothetical protein